MDSKKRIYLDIHILQTVPPSCVNRDDTGSRAKAFTFLPIRVTSKA